MDEWIYFLKSGEFGSDFKAKGLEEAKRKLAVCHMEDEERAAYEGYQMSLHREASLYQSSYVVGREEGREEGREAILAVARELLRTGMAPERVEAITKLSREEIDDLP